MSVNWNRRYSTRHAFLIIFLTALMAAGVIYLSIKSLEQSTRIQSGALSYLGITPPAVKVAGSGLPANPACAADINEDGKVNIQDILLAKTQTNRSCSVRDRFCADLNSDRIVNEIDLNFIWEHFNAPNCPQVPPARF